MSTATITIPQLLRATATNENVTRKTHDRIRGWYEIELETKTDNGIICHAVTWDRASDSLTFGVQAFNNDGSPATARHWTGQDAFQPWIGMLTGFAA